MVILGRWGAQALTLSLKPNSLTVSLQTESESQVFSFDQTGRLWTAMLNGMSYRRGLNGTIIAKWKTQLDARDRRWLGSDEADQLVEHIAKKMKALKHAFQTGEAKLAANLSPVDISVLDSAAAFDANQSQRDAKLFAQIYKPVGILPPDQYMAVVLQAAEGCSFNQCTFCTFYRDRLFRIKSPAEFRLHAESVRSFLGPGLSLRRTIFLGDANALVIPMKRLLPLLDIVHETYDVEELGGIYAFLDGFSGERKTAADYRVLAERGLKRVYVGVESGDDDLLHFLNKPGKADDAVRAIQNMKEGGVAVGVIFLLGAGGRQYAERHIKATRNAINAMQLDADDLIYFSELIESEGLVYTQDAYRADLQPLSPIERIAQGEEIERQLVFSDVGGTPHISRYDIREFIY